MSAMQLRAFPLLVLLAAALSGQEVTWTATPLSRSPVPYGFLLHLPPDFERHPAERHPLVLFLHGRGEIGDSEGRVLGAATYGPLKAIRQGSPLYDQARAVILCPGALASDGNWRNEKISALIDHALRTWRIDPTRIYVTGASMGGGGTWRLVASAPERYAAAVPICGSDSPRPDAPAVQMPPVWAVHAIGDKLNRYERTTRPWIERIASTGAGAAVSIAESYPGGPVATGMLADGAWSWVAGIPRLVGRPGVAPMVTVFPDDNHDSWTRAFSSPALWEWVLAQERCPDAPAGGEPPLLPGAIEAETIATAGPGGGFHRQGEAACSQPPIVTTSDASAGAALGPLAAGDWGSWRLRVAASGTYALRAVLRGTGTVRLLIDGRDHQGPLAVKSTRWQTVQALAPLDAGEHRMRVAVVEGKDVVLDRIELHLRAYDIDDADATFTGPWSERTDLAASGGTFHFSNPPNKPGGRGCFRCPELPSGTYAVWVHAVGAAGHAATAAVQVEMGGSKQDYRCDMRQPGPRWIRLGEQRHRGGPAQATFLTEGAGGYVIADAVRFEVLD
jgi:hypothetical protein